jgi:acyl dehydratase
MKAVQLRYEDIRVGAVYEFERMITKDDVMKFAELTGDYNPLHVDPVLGTQSQFGKNVVHGMLAASLFSTLVGMYCPVKHALYISQIIQFRKPLFYGDNVTVCGTVTRKNDSIHLITMKTEILMGSEVAVSGEAKVRVLA